MQKYKVQLRMSDAISELAGILADWSHPHADVIIYLFGSRVRGDNRSDSDVDVLIDFENPSDSSTIWLTAMENEGYASLKAQLPGRLELLERKSQVAPKVRQAAMNPVHRDRNVICVWLPPTRR